MPSTVFDTNLLVLFTSDSALAGATLALDVMRLSFPNAVVSLDWIWHGGSPGVSCGWRQVGTWRHLRGQTGLLSTYN